MKKKQKNSLSVKQKMAHFLDVPLDMVSNVPRFTLNDNCDLSIENYKAVESYELKEIRLRGMRYKITVTGCDLHITAITDEEILIRGTITGISFT